MLAKKRGEENIHIIRIGKFAVPTTKDYIRFGVETLTLLENKLKYIIQIQ